MEKEKLVFYKPEIEDLWFRRKFMSDEATMSYNHAWGGTIPFPESVWSAWYDDWLVHPENKRFYRYLREPESKEFVGEAACHFDGNRGIWIADVIIASWYRRRGYGTQGLHLLCKAAASMGVDLLYDDMAIDNPALSLFLKTAFRKNIVPTKSLCSKRICGTVFPKREIPKKRGVKPLIILKRRVRRNVDVKKRFDS